MAIHVFGRTFMDLFIYGEKIHNCTIVETPGGSALNASLGFSLLGLTTFIHATYGTDHSGDEIREIIDQYGVKTDYLIQRQEPSNRFISRNTKALAVSVGSDIATNTFLEVGEEDYCLIFATEIHQRTLESIVSKSWRRVFIDLGPKYTHNTFPLKLKRATIIANEQEATNTPCDIVKMGKRGARWHDVLIRGNGQALPYTTGAGDLFDVVLIDHILKGKMPAEALKEAVHMSQKACLIPGSSTKMELLREFNHSV